LASLELGDLFDLAVDGFVEKVVFGVASDCHACFLIGSILRLHSLIVGRRGMAVNSAGGFITLGAENFFNHKGTKVTKVTKECGVAGLGGGGMEGNSPRRYRGHRKDWLSYASQSPN
jgi:hypothetical protein